MSRKNLSLLRRRLVRELTKPSNGSRNEQFYYNFQASEHLSTLSTSATAFYDRINTRGFSSDSSSSSISPTTSTQGSSVKGEIGWKALSARTNDIIDNPLWQIPRKGTGKDAVCIVRK